MPEGLAGRSVAGGEEEVARGFERDEREIR